MNKKERSLIRLKKWEGRLRCVVCGELLALKANHALVCAVDHSYDVARQGYVNLITRHIQTRYDKMLFHARRTVIQDSGLYDTLHQKLIELIGGKKGQNPSDLLFLADLGSGEGSHLARILQDLDNATGVGLDLSKEGIQEATKHEEAEAIWLAADLSKAPLTDDAVDVALTVLSPSNYEEIKRIMAPGGLALKVIPNSGYLQEIRHFFRPEDEPPYDNKDILQRFAEAFPNVREVEVKVQRTLNPEMKKLLCRMTPLSWHATEEEILDYVKKGPDDITIDLTILIGTAPR